MTPEALKDKRIAEAWRLSDGTFADTMDRLADLYETNWTPPEPVSDDVLAFRAWLKDCGRYSHRSVDAGELDSEAVGRAYLAGCTRGREGAKGLVEALEHLRIAIREAPMATFIARHMTQVIDDAIASAKRGG